MDIRGRLMSHGHMTFANESHERGHLSAAVISPEMQDAVWFLGALVRIRAGGDMSGNDLAILEHVGERGYSSPIHRHERDEETFFVLEGELRVEVDGLIKTAGPGAAAFLPRQLPHGFVVTSPQARFLTLHTPAGFDRFVQEAGTPADPLGNPPADLIPPDPVKLSAMAKNYGIEIIGPPPTP